MKMLGLLSLIALFLTGCEKTNSDDAEQLRDMMRLAQAPAASEQSLSSKTRVDCTGKTKNICAPEGCEQGPVTVNQSYEIQSGVYTRVDKRGSEEFSGRLFVSGIWYNIFFPERQILFKFNTLGDFSEVVVQNDIAVIYHGTCRVS